MKRSFLNEIIFVIIINFISANVCAWPEIDPRNLTNNRQENIEGNPIFKKPRIVNGKRVDISEIPYQVQIIYLRQYLICGGTIVTRRSVISAAHCFGTSRSPHDYSIIAGTTYSKTGGDSYTVNDVIVHPLYSDINNDFDFSILHINGKFRKHAFSDPISLTKTSKLLVGHEGRVSGWGRTSYNGEPSYTLMHLYLPIMKQSQCEHYYSDQHITYRMFCAGYQQGVFDACIGDSGGPFVVDNELYGVVSWGIECALANRPGVYSRISSVRTWIENNLL